MMQTELMEEYTTQVAGDVRQALSMRGEAPERMSMKSIIGMMHRDRAFDDLGLYPAKQFCTIVERERALVHRNGHAFSLLVFDMSAYRRDDRKLRAFAKVGARRLRKTDMMGWLNAQRTGVLLPYTSFQSAKQVADSFVTELGREGMRLTFVVHTYPAGDKPQEPPAQGDSRGQQQVGPAMSVSGDGNGESPEQPAPEQDMKAMVLPPCPPWKRAMDIVLSLLLLLLTSPVMLLLALLIKIVSPRGGILFKQERIGFLGNRFTCFKFRSMHVQSEEAVHHRHMQHLMQADVPMTKLDARKDKRLIPLGQLLRASGLDELPQLLNVLRGDMSLVGPRPCLQYEYQSFQLWHRMRFDTLPGLTGLWQVSGKNRTTFTQMMRLDVSYAQQRSLWNDFRILAMTFPAVLKQVLELAVAQKGNELAVTQKGNAI